MSYYDRLIQQGEAKGRAEVKAEGKAEGIIEGRRSLVTKLLALKFGALDASTRARLEAATLEELDRIAERILTSAAMDDVFE